MAQNENLFRTLLENLVDGVFCHGMDGRFIIVNKRACEMTGYTREELMQLTVADIDAEAMGRGDREKIWARLNAGETVQLKSKHKHKDNTIYHVDLQFNKLVIDGLSMIMVLARDITDLVNADREREMLNKQLLQAQKMEAVGQLAGGMAHDFNNLLGVILGAAQLAMADVEPESSVSNDLETIVDASRRARLLTDQLLTFSRKERISVQSVLADELVNDVLKMVERTFHKNIMIKTNIQESLYVEVDRNQVQQALLNIFNNSRDSMPEGGLLSIDARRFLGVSIPCGTCSKTISGDFCIIQIRDNGRGMKEDVLARIFEPFFSTKGAGQGTGLGLSTSLGIVQNHSGHIMIDSKPDTGTIVSVFLPLLQSDAMRADDTEAEAEPPGGDETILLVDDEKKLLEITRRMLEGAGYRVLTAKCGFDAIAVFQEKSDEIDAVILDLIMPGMDGGDVVDEIRGICPEVRIVLSSGYSVSGQVAQLLESGARAFVQKPFTPRELLSMLRKVLDE